MLLALSGGLAVGLLMGALGGGGAILAIPLLVYGFGFAPTQATLASLVIVGIGAITGVATHARTLDWRRGAVFGAFGMAGAYIGRLLAAGLDGTLLLLAFSLLLLVVASLMVGKTRRSTASAPGRGGRQKNGQDAAALFASPRQGLRLVGAATGVGFLTGFFGVGGGFAIVPALTLILGLSMGVAVGTSLLVILINSTLALALGAGALASLDWGALAPLLLAVVAGTLLGTWLGQRMLTRTLQVGFAGFLYLVAVYMAISSVVELMR